MKASHAYAFDGVVADPAPDAVARLASLGTAIEIADAARLSDLHAAWIDLLARADVPNVFMDPLLLHAAAENYPENETRALLAWDWHDGQPHLSGVWAFAVGRPRMSVLPVRVLAAPPAPHGYLSAPVIDRECLDETLDAMLDAIAGDPGLPKIIALDSMATDTPTMHALARVLERRDSVASVFQRFNRPKLESKLDAKAYWDQALSSSSRKKLRQHRRRLGEKGALTSEVISEPSAIREALERFLAMEEAGWKGREGSAISCDPRDAAFMRAAVGALAEQGRAAIHALYLDRRPVSLQIVAHSGRAAFTWKTAYDEQLHDFSPGMLLLEDYTAALLADQGVAYVDSCAYDDTSYMAAWTERQPIADLWFDARRGGSLTFRVVSAAQKIYRALRTLAKTSYLKHFKSLQRRG